MSIRYKYVRLLTEGYNFSNTDEVLSALKANQIGVKIQPWLKTDQQGSIPRKLAFNSFFKRCEEMGIKDTTYGVQLLCSKCKDLLSMQVAVREDGLYEFLKSYKKPWVKQLIQYKEFMEDDGTSFNRRLHELEKAIQYEQSNHGKAVKGGGDLKDVKVPYNDGTWKLMIPSSFQGAKAASFYIKDGQETPTEWCTRCDEYHYKHYTAFGPLFIIRNMKTGKSYQMAFMQGDVEFLDQNDIKGDEITDGDLRGIPDELLKHVKDPNGGKTLYDFKHKKPNSEAFPHVKGKLNNREVAENPLNKTTAKYGPVIDLGQGVCKREVTNFSHDLYRPDELSDFFHWDGAKYSPIPLEYGKKDKATIYYLKNKPNSVLALATGKNLGAVDAKAEKRIIDGRMYQKNWDDLEPNEQYKVEQLADKDFGVKKNLERQASNRFKKEGASKIADKFNEAFQKSKQKIINNINNSHILDKTAFEVLVDISSAEYKANNRGTDPNRLRGETLPKMLTFKTKKGIKVDIYFRKGGWGDSTHPATYNEADRVAIVPLTDNGNMREDSGEIFKICKAVAKEVMKQIIKMPEYKYANSTRKEYEWQKANSQNEGYVRRNSEDKNISDRKVRRDADDLTRKRHNKTYISDIDGKEHYYGEPTHVNIHESVNYFPY